MAISRPLRPLVVLLGLLVWASLTTATTSVAIALCASINTATTNANSSVYQSDGLCYGFCKDDYAYAILQDDNCWCSDYMPATSVQVDMSECNLQCPGYPDDLCGGTGVFGYITGNQKASGTKGGETSTTATPTSTVANTPATTKTPDTSVTTPTTTPTPSTYLSTVTQGGSVVLQTVTVMPPEPPAAGASSTNVSTGGKPGLSTGAAVGVAVGVLAALVIIAAAIVWFWLRRRKRNQEESMLEHQNSFRGSSAGMMSTPRTEMASMWDGDGQSNGRRNSRLMPHDPRMEPTVTNLYGRFDNKSHESINTLRDDQDYSRRVLRTTNPDPTG